VADPLAGNGSAAREAEGKNGNWFVSGLVLPEQLKRLPQCSEAESADSRFEFFVQVKDYIRTFSGKKLHGFDPQPEEICIEDIAHGLTLNSRWNGQSLKRYSVAAHSMCVASMVPREHRLLALLHDGSEAFLSDIAKPFKVRLPDYIALEDRLMKAIAAKFGFQWPMPNVVKKADKAALYLERMHLFNSPVHDDVARIIPPKGCPLGFWDFDFWTTAPDHQIEQHFLDHFARYSKRALAA
jgi:hypothetical protein